MALFGKKAKDGASDSPLADGAGEEGGVAVTDAPTSGKKVKAARAPKPPKAAKSVKNGVAVGLNIGNQFIKAVEVTSKNGELSVTAMGAVPTPPESYTNGNVLSVSALSGAIRDLWKGAGIKSKVAITSVTGTGALVVRVIEVPKMSDGELGDNMKVDADRYIPFPPSEVVMDFKALRELPTDPDAPNMEVLLAAAQREIIDLHVNVVQKARLDPRAIDVEPVAAARAMQLERRASSENFIDYNEVTALVNLGATGTEISILRGDILVFTRVVPGGGNVITQAIAEGMGLPFGDAERVKIENADAIAPAGYNVGGAYADSGDFNFGDDFSGGDLNSAFDDISANPSATAASDDPFDLDFFNQTPQNEPGAGHAQKEGEPGDNPPSAFNFSDFNFDASPPASPPGAPSTPVTSPAPEASIAFDFGFDDLSDADLPSVAADAPPIASSDKSTANLEAATPPVATPIFSTPVVAAPEFASATGSAFDFDNFDLPEAIPGNLTTTSIPIEPPRIAEPTPSAPVVAPVDFGFEAPSVPTAAPETGPINFDFEDDALASKNSSPATSPLIPEEATDPSISEPKTAIPAPVATPASDFDFSLSEPAPIVSAPPISVPDVPDAPTFESVTPEPVPVEPAPLTAVAPSAPASQSDEFDLDAIFGGPAVPTAAATTAPVVPLSLTKDVEGDAGISVEEFGAPSVEAAPVAAASGSDDFDLSGIDTGDAGGFGAGFVDSGDFTDFGAGLGAGGAGADAAALYGLIYPPLEELAAEVRRSLEFHLGRYPDATISRLVLLGGGARLRNLDVFLTQMIGVPTAVANPFSHITVHTPKLAPGYANENGPLCSVALGLALRDFVD